MNAGRLKRRGQNNIMKFMSNSDARPGNKAALSLSHHLIVKATTVSCCSTHGWTDKTASGERSLFSERFVSTH